MKTFQNILEEFKGELEQLNQKEMQKIIGGSEDDEPFAWLCESWDSTGGRYTLEYNGACGGMTDDYKRSYYQNGTFVASYTDEQDQANGAQGNGVINAGQWNNTSNYTTQCYCSASAYSGY